MRSRLGARLRSLRAGTASAQPVEQDAGIPEMLARTVEAADLEIIRRCRPYTLTSPERLLALIDAVRYCIRTGLSGAFAECGVWRGGSVLAMILVLQDLGVGDRDLYLYDTFEGMTAPSEHDTSRFGEPALATWERAQQDGAQAWSEYFGHDVFNEEALRRMLEGTGYAADRLNLVRGDVAQTLPDSAPESLALLRLDTDWYESTRHELEHLYPRLAPGGVLIIDDYGHWEGARRAVDEYFGERPPLLNRIDYTGRIAVKH